MNQRNRSTALRAGALLLAACGGGGGGGDAAPVSVTLSGSIAVAETAAVDSDLNDINQSGYKKNDTPATAQALNTPVLLVGTVNRPNAGPAGTNFAAGDLDDGYRVTLAAGQVVELEFANDPARADVDLYLYLAATLTLVGRSDRTDSRFECVLVTAPGTYLIQVNAFSGASIYNLRIGAPGTAGSCPNRTAAASFDPAHLLALPRRSSDAAATIARERKAGVQRVAAAGAGPQLLRLPTGARERAQGLSALAGGSASVPAADGWPAETATLIYAKHLRASGAYQYVQPNYLQQRLATTGTFPPNDRGYSYQRWHYEQINLPAAMERIVALPAQPSVRPIAAIIDDGIVIDHPDLAPQLASNGRAFISNAAPGDGNQPTADDPSRSGDNPVFHGTHVAGTVGAATFDGIGAASVAPMAQLLPLRVFAPGRGAGTLDIVNAMLYAARLPNNSNSLPARRADVINLSLGSDGACEAAFQDAIDKVRAAGVVVVVAAGNSGRNDINRRAAVGNPANCNGALAVSATDNRKTLTAYSNTGAEIVVSAPGGDTSQSTTGNGAPDGVYSDLGSFEAGGVRQASFGPLQGTSMAAPHVAGVMALVRYVNPALTPLQIDSLLQSGALTDELGAAGRDIDYGFGLINARKAVDAALEATGNPPPAPLPQVIARPSSIDFGSSQVSVPIDIGANGTNERVVSIGADNPAVTVVPTANVDPTSKLGTYTVTVDRNMLGGVGSFFPTLTVTLAPARSFSVQLAVTKPDPAQAGARDFGPVYVLLIDPDTDQVVKTVLATRAANGTYGWTSSGYALPRVAVVAGGDLDNDDLICARGEPCGAFPVLETTGNPTPIVLGGDRSDLNFRVAPLSGISAQSAAGPAGRGWRRNDRSSAR